MKKLIYALAFSAFLSFGSFAQLKTPPASPAATVTQGVGLTSVTISYSRPSVKGRTIFGNLTPYGKVWRTGANTITSIKLDEDLLVNGKTVKAGSYGLYTIPGEKTWKIIFNADDKQWGAYAYDAAKDVYSFDVSAIQLNDLVENMTIEFTDFTANSTNVQISWEKTAVKFKLEHDVKDRILAQIREKTADPNANIGTLMGAADYYYENDIDLDKALGWALKVVEKDQKYYTYQLAARIAAKMGKCDVALANADKSLPLAKEAGDDAYIKLNEAVFAKCRK